MGISSIILRPMEESIKEIGKMGNKRGREHMLIRKEYRKKEYGRMELD